MPSTLTPPWHPQEDGLKRKIAAAAALAAAALTASACSSSSSGNNATPQGALSTQGAGKTVHVWIMQDAHRELLMLTTPAPIIAAAC